MHYLADFIAERPQPMRAPDISFFVELLALLICPVALLLFAISLALSEADEPRRAHDSEPSASNQSMKPTAPDRISVSNLATDAASGGLSLFR